MLSQIVRPLVDNQIRLLASSQNTYSTLIETIARWLSYLGVQAQVTYLTRQSEKIKVSLTVGKPDLCNSEDWQQILDNLDRQKTVFPINSYDQLTSEQRRKLQRLFAYLIQISQPDKQNNLDLLSNSLKKLHLDDLMIMGVKSALKVPQSVDRLLKELKPNVIALAFPQVMEIILMDSQLNQETEIAIITMLTMLKATNNSNSLAQVSNLNHYRLQSIEQEYKQAA
ncbi:MAG: hypothetical protein ACRC2S_08055 [Waterburya sp.]